MEYATYYLAWVFGGMASESVPWCSCYKVLHAVLSWDAWNTADGAAMCCSSVLLIGLVILGMSGCLWSRCLRQRCDLHAEARLHGSSLLHLRVVRR